MPNRLILAGLFLIVLCSSCHRNPLDIDVSGIQVEPVQIARFEQDLFKLPSDLNAVASKYGDFYRGFVETTLCSNGIGDPGCLTNIQGFIHDKDMRLAYEDCQKKYPSVHTLEKEIEEVFKHYKYYFPQRPLPALRTTMSGFNYAFLRLDKTIGIGLEMYLGSNSDFYKMLQYPKYKMANMSAPHILPDFVKSWMLTEFEEKDPKNDFLTRIVNEGKIAYLTDALLPNMHDTLKMGFTASQLNWCKLNEAHVWSFFIQRKILYSTDYQEIIQFTNDGPFTTGFSKESPPRTGIWIGTQIVRSFMNRNKQVTLQQLMEMKDAQKLLAAAGYKPKL